jgi:hypothetical protein
MAGEKDIAPGLAMNTTSMVTNQADVKRQALRRLASRFQHGCRTGKAFDFLN